MSSSAVDVEVRLKMRDGATAGIKAVSQTAQQEAAKTATATEKAAQKAADATQKSAARQRSSYEKLSQAREALGVRSERAIQREIQQTEAAYNRLKASGTLSWQQQAAAADKMRQKVTQLTNEMGKLTAAQKAYAGVKFAAAGVAGTAAAAYTLKAPATSAMSFDERLAHMSNTAFAERDTSGRKIGMQQLEKAINKSVGKGGGGTREQAAEALDTLIASGAVGAQDAMNMLPQLMRFSSASGADATQLAQIGIRAMQTFKVKADDLPNLMNMALAAGQAGGFELRDMSKWLPQQMAAATMSGMSGRAGFAKLAALNQAAAITAGTKDEAGNNVVNLLAKINSSDTANDAKKLGINLPKYLQEQRAKGLDSVDAFGALVDKTVAGRADYQALQKQLKSAKTDDDKKAALESMATIAQGAGIGKLIQDRQAMMALLGMMNNREYLQEVLSKVKANDVATGGAGDKNYDLISGTSAFKMRQAEQQRDIGQKAAMDSLTPAIGKAAEAFADLASKHPLLVGTTTLATTALGALAGAAGLASIAMGGKGIPGGSAISRASAWATASKVGQGAMRLAKIGGISAAASALGGYALDKGFGEDSAISRYGSSALSGAALGATVGSIVPVLGTGVGAAIGGSLGVAWEGIKDLLKPVEQKPVDVNFKGQIGLAPGLVLQGTSMQTSGGNAQMNTGNLWNGAP
ncbi:phage tail tape measure protein [Rhodocyclus tenuis]|uniref:Phage tail tape measure protein n=1 Tax=Rhodocyclus gracilis TaxID=2929842 RepID=A0ABX0WDF8_9RHOO|nr:phage tail tape measure protein [Rhodocyclus gracilis]MRD73292.1 phage tail tape measure protein [Rhodocyclus gracilis]NJA87707.1 phage tail tape measure protein [Rhodocyclus gracilis]